MVGAFAGGYAMAHGRVVTNVITRTVTPPPVIRTQIRVVIHTFQPSPRASSEAAVASAVSFACKVEQASGGGEEYEVTAMNGAAYTGTVQVSFYDYAGSGDIFPPVSLPGTAAAGSAANWHPMPAADIGASAEPSGCVARAQADGPLTPPPLAEWAGGGL
jgi:hypothetical protein